MPIILSTSKQQAHAAIVVLNENCTVWLFGVCLQCWDGTQCLAHFRQVFHVWVEVPDSIAYLVHLHFHVNSIVHRILWKRNFYNFNMDYIYYKLIWGELTNLKASSFPIREHYVLLNLKCPKVHALIFWNISNKATRE